MSTFEHKNSLRTTEAQIVQKLKNNEAWPKFIGSYKKKKRVALQLLKLTIRKQTYNSVLLKGVSFCYTCGVIVQQPME